MSVSNMPPIDRAEQSTAHEIQQAKVIDLNDRFSILITRMIK